jgi:hypothetical protein
MAGEDEREARIRDLRDRFDRMLHRLLERRVEYRDFGPRDDVQPDGRIYEEVTERLTTDPRLDATDIAVSVAEGIVTLDGTVKNRAEKRLAEDCVDTVSGVRDVNNNLRIREEQARHDTGEPREGMGGHRTAI